MGLSSTPKEQVTIAQLMVECVGVLKRMSAGEMEKMAKEAFALPEREQERADEARGKIATYEGLIAESKKTLAAIDTAKAELSAKELAHQAMLRRIDEENTKLSSRKADLDLFASGLNVKAGDLQSRERALEAGIAKIDRDRMALDTKASELAEYEKSLKSKASALKNLTESM